MKRIIRILLISIFIYIPISIFSHAGTPVGPTISGSGGGTPGNSTVGKTQLNKQDTCDASNPFMQLYTDGEKIQCNTAAEHRTALSLGNVDNTSDANKPVSTAQQTALDLKAPLASPTFTGTVTFPTPFTLGAVSVLPTGTELNFVDGVTSAIQTQLDLKLTITSADTEAELETLLTDIANVFTDADFTNGICAKDANGDIACPPVHVTNADPAAGNCTGVNEGHLHVKVDASGLPTGGKMWVCTTNNADGITSPTWKLLTEDLGAVINALTAKTIPTVADLVGLSDAAAGNAGKKSTLQQIFNALNSTTEDSTETSTDFMFYYDVVEGAINKIKFSDVTAGGVLADGLTEPMLKAVDAAADEECLTYETTTGDFEWQACGGTDTGYYNYQISCGDSASDLTDVYLKFGGNTNADCNASATFGNYSLMQVLRAGNIKNLWCALGTAPGTGNSVIFTVQDDGVNSTVTCTIADTATECKDSVNTSAAVAADSELSVLGDKTGVAFTSGNFYCGFEYTFTP